MDRSLFLHGGINLSVVRSGAGRAFIFQHGLCGTADQPREVFPYNMGWQCLTLECRGHGASEPGDPALFSISTFADDIVAFIDSLNAGPMLVGGISMGAAIAMRVAVTRPDLVRGLVVARPAWIDRSAPENLAPNLEVGRLLAAHPPAEALHLFDASATARRLGRDAPDNLLSLRRLFCREPAAVTQKLLVSIAGDGPRIDREEIARIACPTLVIGHGRDAIHPVSMAREIARIIPAARFVEIAPKADSVEKHQLQFRLALRGFLEGIA